MTPDQKRRAIAEQQTSDPQEIEALTKWMAENIDDGDLDQSGYVPTSDGHRLIFGSLPLVSTRPADD